jgi:predicted 3-demethylubiquinone-9 3-methyltransferase (glyoxalase superfamily)
MKPKNTICLWFNKDAHDAARFYRPPFRIAKSPLSMRHPATIRAVRRAMY